MKFIYYDIVFQEVPDEVSLCFYISNCGKQCKGCHSPDLQKNIGEELTTDLFQNILNKYKNDITCILFLGGSEKDILQFLPYTKPLKLAWYTSDCPKLNLVFDFIKTGPYIKHLGGLTSPKTNQKFYKNINNQFIEIKIKSPA